MQDFSELYLLTQNLSVLLVEDHEEILETTAEILENYFHRVDTAENGLSGLEQYVHYRTEEGKTYDLVITDIEMPLKNGVELVKEIRQLHETQKIIILSAHDESHYLRDLINLGISYYIPKPIEPDSLFQALCKVTRDNQHVSEERDRFVLDDTCYYDASQKVLYRNKKSVKLTKHEFFLLEILVQKFEEVSSTEEIIAGFAKKDVTITADNIRYHISKLRKKLPDNSIESLYAVGYKLKAARSIARV